MTTNIEQQRAAFEDQLPPLPEPDGSLVIFLSGRHGRLEAYNTSTLLSYARQAIELDRQGRRNPVVWAMAPQQVIMLAEELIVGALAMGGADYDGVESDVRLMIRMPGTVADDDGKLNERPIFAFCSGDCKPTHEHVQQPAEPAVKESLTTAEMVKWEEAQRIADLPEVDELLQGFTEDPTGDAGTMIVRAVIQAVRQPAEPVKAECRSPYCECEKGKCTHGLADKRGELGAPSSEQALTFEQWWAAGGHRIVSTEADRCGWKGAAGAGYIGGLLASAPTTRQADGQAQHQDDIAVEAFAAVMKAKLAKKRDEGRGGWQDREQCSAEWLSELLRGHIGKGDPVDVANLAMMLHQRGESITCGNAVSAKPDPEMAGDAARYQWLRRSDTGPAKLDSLHSWVNDDCNPPYRELKYGNDLDAAIDAALQQEKP